MTKLHLHNTVIGTCEPWKKFILNPLFGFNLKFLYFILIRLYKHVVWLSNDLFCQFLRQVFLSNTENPEYLILSQT